MPNHISGVHGGLSDFDLRPGDSDSARRAQSGPQGARRWGNRVLLALVPDPHVNPNLCRQSARSSATLIDIADLSAALPIALQVRFAAVNPATGSAILPFSEVNPIIGPPPYVSPNSQLRLTFTVRRGIDPLAPVGSDSWVLNGLNTYQDSVPYDIITARSLGIDAAISMFTPSFSPAPTTAQLAMANIWVEVLAAPVDHLPPAGVIPGYQTILQSSYVAASAVGAYLLPPRNCRAQFIIENTSTDAPLWLGFGFQPTISTPHASVIVPIGGRYESPVGGYSGVVWGIWKGGTPSGGALVTDGTRKTHIVISEE